jgi:hypothetical protein
MRDRPKNNRPAAAPRSERDLPAEKTLAGRLERREAALRRQQAAFWAANIVERYADAESR